MDDLLVSFDKVTIRSREQMLYPGISFEIKKGEHWVFTGDNESLKNALLYALAGKAGIAGGNVKYPFYEVFIADNEVDDPLFSPHKLVAMIGSRHTFRNLSNTTELYYQQRYNALDTDNAQTVLEYLGSIKAPGHQPAWTLGRVVKELHISPHLHKRVIQLSNGETKRVRIAAAVLRNPVLLLLDNPLTGLDTPSRKEIGELINQLAHSGITIVMSGGADEIPGAINRVAVFERGDKISRLLKKDFPGFQKNPGYPAISDAAVKALLSSRPAVQYKYIVRMKHIAVRYGDKQVLQDINWTIRQGERWALLGSNGAGKSTLLSLINGDNPQAYANDIVLFDQKRGTGESIWDIKSRIGYVSAELYQYFPGETSCLHAVESGFYDTLGLFRRSQAANREVALEWMKLLGIAEHAGRLLRHVSPAIQRLCLLARALVKTPPLLILDEPCQGMDAGQQAGFRALLDMICAFTDLTLIYVTHYEQEIPVAVTRVFKLADGKQVQEEAVRKLP